MAENTKGKKKLSKLQLRTVIVTAISAVIGLALIITNIFVPVKYLASYMVSRNKGAAEGVMRVRFVDVGYGDCTIVELPDGKTMLIDAGNGLSSNTGRILKYLNECDINVIDYLVCTSVNSEHCGGFYEIFQYREVKTVYSPSCSNSSITDGFYKFSAGLRSYNCAKNEIKFGRGEENAESGYFFKFLSPSAYGNDEGEYADMNNNPSSETARNNASAVIWLQYGETGFLFTSDAGSEELTAICNAYEVSADYPVNLENCTVVQVSNHGSAKSGCAEFYELVNAEAAVISVGENAKGNPSLEVIADLKQKQTNVYRTDENGTVTVEVTADGYRFV